MFDCVNKEVSQLDLIVDMSLDRNKQLINEKITCEFWVYSFVISVRKYRVFIGIIHVKL